jgi:hypothetical protein
MKRPATALPSTALPFVALLVLTAVAPAVVPASSPPQALCSVCDDGFERAAVPTVLGLLFGAPLYLLGGSLANAGEASDES